MPKIYDNIENKLTQGLLDNLSESRRADFCVGYFNLRGWKLVADKIDQLEGESIQEGKKNHHRTCRLLVGMQKSPVDIISDLFSMEESLPVDMSEALKIKKKLAQEFKDQLTIGKPTKEDEAALRKLSTQLKDKKLVVKLFLRNPLHAKLYLAYSDDRRVPVVGFLGSSNLTLAGLDRQGELNIDVLDQDAATKLSKWFQDRWVDNWCIDITEELIEIIDNSWASETLISPYYIYLKIAYHLSREARAGINEYKLPRVFQRELLDFQQKAVQVAAHHLHKRDGVIIGDVVGLGKTITATALAKIFEDDFFLETLIICPKNLVGMWEDYAYKYQLRAKIISQSKVQSELPELRRYRLVIIDESHNLRNDEGSRYRAIKSYLEENESKVILLSATPYNKSYTDLSNQLRLFISDDKDLGITPEKYIESIGGQVQFSSKHTETFIRSIKAFEKSHFSDDWQELMRLYLVRRTRSFIKNHYAETDKKSGRKYLQFANGDKSYFPDRIPKRVLYEFNQKDKKDIYAKMYSEKVVNSINSMELPRYGLQQYLNPHPTIKPSDAEQKVLQNMSHAGRRLMGFCRTNLFKRLESSGYSFLLSLGRHILRNYLFIYALENHLPIPIGKNISQNLDGFLEDSDTDGDEGEEFRLNIILKEEDYLKKSKELYALFSSDAYKHKFDWVRSGFFDSSLQQTLISDSRELIQILGMGKEWNPETDRQLNALHSLISETHPKEKLLIFTQFADTAYYLSNELKKRGVTKVECVTGDDENPTHKAHRFSPDSNDKPEYKGDQEIRVLITTDVLSEGQNLQDAHLILNYDLPWAIIRLIQRAGRVDRIGQKAEQIFCYSFLPEQGIEDIIKLRSRLTHRIKENAEVVGSDETFFDGDPINLSDLYSEKSGILDGEDDESEVDLASLAYQIWKEAIEKNPELQKTIPNLQDVIYSTKGVEENVREKSKSGSIRDGVIVFSKSSDENDMLTWVDTSGNLVTQSQHAILKAAECQPDTRPLPRMENHHELVAKGLEYIRQEEINTEGTLGKKTSVKYRVFMRLDRYIQEFKDTLFVNEPLKKAVDDIFKYPLKEFAKETLSRQLKSGISDGELSSLVISLREEEKLVISSEEETHKKGPSIICSMGMVKV